MLGFVCTVLISLLVLMVALAILKAFPNSVIVKFLVWGLLIFMAIILVLNYLGLALLLGGI